MTEVSMHVDMDLHDIACNLSSLPYEEILEFIEQLDSHVADWEFTQKCYEYFNHELSEKIREDLEHQETNGSSYVNYLVALSEVANCAFASLFFPVV